MYEGQFYQTNSLFQIPPLKPGRTTIILLMPLLCGDIELNPGPGNTSIYLCGCCERIVNWSQKAVCCDDGSIWQHMTCVCMCSIDYEGALSPHLGAVSNATLFYGTFLLITHTIRLLAIVSIPCCPTQVTLRCAPIITPDAQKTQQPSDH